MKLGIIISQTEPETVWNAYRLGTYAPMNSGWGVRDFCDIHERIFFG